uniref:Cuticular protein PpolCPH32 n=1 Tax=Papilio polytes TaxID=76194 RepID=I4DMM0_PAPPL|nr:cuticular protein PpolCPH32 [Papilio polytes]
MKAIVCLLVVAVAGAVYGAEEKKNEKRGLLGLGYGGYGGHGLSYGLAAAPVISHGVSLDYGIGHGIGYGLGGHGLGYGLGGHGLSYSVGGHGLGYSLGGHGLGYGLGGHGLVAAAPVLSHSVYSAPLLGLGHGHGYLH